jgi:ABC-type antimicrobial peptide transport system permease subunit
MGMNEQIDSTIVPQRLFATLSAGFGALGALLAVIGLYGLLAYTVVWRTHEIGVRMALGAAGTDVMRIVLRDALWMVCAGLAIGAPLAFWGKRVAGICMDQNRHKTKGSHEKAGLTTFTSSSSNQ